MGRASLQRGQYLPASLMGSEKFHHIARPATDKTASLGRLKLAAISISGSFSLWISCF